MSRSQIEATADVTGRTKCINKKAISNQQQAKIQDAQRQYQQNKESHQRRPASYLRKVAIIS